MQAADCWRSVQVLCSTSPLLKRPGIPLERPSGAGGGAGRGVGKLVGAGCGRWDTRARQEEGARVPAASPALGESQPGAAVTSPISPDVFRRSLVELNSPQWALWGASSLTSTRV